MKRENCLSAGSTSVTFRDPLDGKKWRSDYAIVFFQQLVIKMPQQTLETAQSDAHVVAQTPMAS